MRRAAVLAGVAGLACVAHAQRQAPIQAPTLVDRRPTPAPKAAVLPVSVSMGVKDVPSVRLGPVDVVQLLREDAKAAADGDKRLRYGVARAVSLSAASGRWFDVPGSLGGGRVWVADIDAAGAVGVRVHLVDLRLPRGATVFVLPMDDPADVAGPYEGAGPYGNGQVWTPTRGGESVRIELRVPASVGMPVGDAFRVDGIQHIYRDPMQPSPDQACHNDVTCFPAWSDTAKACGGIGFIGQNSIFCSGQLLNTLVGDQTPYFLTAAQCIGTMAQAQSSEIFFKYQTATCNGAPPAIASVPRATGCTLLATNATLDFSLLMIDGSLPAGLSWAGWTSAAVSDGAPAACIHFPLGGFERISFGAKASNTTCGGPGFVRMNWTSGPTEPGSVGGGVFLDAPGQPLFGQLACGPSTCASVTNDDFGSFSAAYPGVAALLAMGSDDAFEPNDSCGRARVMGLGTYPGLVVKGTDEDWFSVSLEPGETLTAAATFTHANGDIDIEMYSECGSLPVAASTGQTGWESASWSNGGPTAQSVLVRVFLASDTRNTYTLSLSTSVPPGSGACCLPDGGCAIRSSGECIALGGVFAGSETTCAGSCSTSNYVGASIPISDGVGTSTCGPVAIAQVTVPDSFRIAAVRAGVRIVHAYQGDLKFSLRHLPTGTTVSLVDRPGVPQTTFGYPNDNYGASATDLFLSLDSAAQRYDWPAQGTDNVRGWWRPEAPLGAFAGENASGIWQLLVQDCAQGETGVIEAFQVTFAAAPVVPCPANCDGSTGLPVLTGNDFQCFINLYSMGSTLANCDGSTGVPALTANDFQCFMGLYVAGCS